LHIRISPTLGQPEFLIQSKDGLFANAALQ